MQLPRSNHMDPVIHAIQQVAADKNIRWMLITRSNYPKVIPKD